MTWLYIDTRSKDRAKIGWLPEQGKITERNVQGRARAVLRTISKEWDERAPDLRGVIVVSGPGSFSSIRTGVLYSNLFSRFLGIPLYEIRGSHDIDLEETRRLAVEGKLEKKTYVPPIYDREPNITKPKS